MDEKPNRFIMNNEKPLDDNGFSSIDNHQENIDNLDDSSKNEKPKLQNDQGNQLNNKVDNKFINKNMPRNTNPKMNSKMDMAKKKIGQNATRAGLDAATGGAYEGIRKVPLVGTAAKKIEEKAGDKLSDKINKFRHPIKSRFGLNKDKENKESTDSVDVMSSAKKIGKIASIGATILSALFPAIVLIMILAVLYAPIGWAIDAVGGFFENIGERFVNYWENGKFSTNEELEEAFNAKVDEIITAYPELSREALVALAYYTENSPEDYLDSLDKDSIDKDGNLTGDASDALISMYSKMSDRLASLANQMVYSTVIFRNDLVRVEEEEEVEEEIEDKEEKEGKDKKSKKQKTKKKKVTYHCPAGTQEFTSTLKEFCENGISKYKGGSPNLETADECIDMTHELDDKEAPKDKKCYEITYETNTERSNTKLENFIRYGKLADGFDKKVIGFIEKYVPFSELFEPAIYVYEEIEQELSGYYDWDDMVSKFSSVGGETIYNIPAYKVGEGKEIDNYSKLGNNGKNTIDNKIRLIMGMVELASDRREKLKQYIKGNATLPLDFVIRESAEETINSRITSKFGNRIHPVTGVYSFHKGVDFSHISTSDPVYSLLDGVVVSTTTANTGCGIGALIGHDTDMDMKYDYYTRYCHFSSINVSVGQSVYNGQRIGTMGNTGTSTGIHLHFEIHDENNSPMDPVPYLIDIVKNTSTLKTGPNNITDLDSNLNQKYSSLMDGNYRKRKGTIITANFSVDNISTLPYFCGGYTKNLIDNNWFTDKVVTNSSCSNYNQNSKYGLDTEGYVSWVLTQVGIINKRYSINEFKNLGDNVDIFDDKVKEGDLAYTGNKIGIITNVTETEATVIYMDESGLVLKTFNKKLVKSVFDKAILMDKIYE